MDTIDIIHLIGLFILVFILALYFAEWLIDLSR